MDVRDVLSALLVVSGCAFFLAGTVGMLRFPDTHTRLHALTKADNLGLGLVVAGVAVQATSVPLVVKLIVIWLLALLASATACQLIAAAALAHRERAAREQADA